MYKWIDAAFPPTPLQAAQAKIKGYKAVGFYPNGQSPPLEDPFHTWTPYEASIARSAGLVITPIWVPTPNLASNPAVEAAKAFAAIVTPYEIDIHKTGLYDGNHLGPIPGPIWQPIPGDHPLILQPEEAIQNSSDSINGWSVDVSVAADTLILANILWVDFEYNTIPSLLWYQTFAATIAHLGGMVPLPPDEIGVNNPHGGVCINPINDAQYWVWTADGGIFAFGGAGFFGAPASAGSVVIESMAVTPTGKGYLLKGSDGAIFAYGDAHYSGRVIQN